MPTLDIWSNAASWRLRGLIQSSIANLLLAKVFKRPIYLCSPWISDFPVFDNANGQFSSLVPGASDRMRINLSDCLAQLSTGNDVRIVSKKTPSSDAFCRMPILSDSTIQIRMSDDKLHEKGILTPLFYIEGSMNITFSGVRLNTEKVIFHSGDDPSVQRRIQNAYLEFERRWRLLA
jgi:hypothetical protein